VSAFEAPLQEAPRGGAEQLAVTVERDVAQREVEVPDELAAALKESAGASAAFDALSYSHRREHALYVGEAKKAETRERRARATVERLLGPG
jgi:uncharacterized protein YdeI (YjbR/CyaY-like superfamily)